VPGTFAPHAPASMLVYLLAATGVVVGLAFIFFVVIKTPIVLANTGSISRRPAQLAVLLDPIANKARMEAERSAIAIAKEMNDGTKAAQNHKQPVTAPSQESAKRKRATQARKVTRVARQNDTRQNAWAYEPQKTFSLSWW
jgi:hypothetical protein